MKYLLLFLVSFFSAQMVLAQSEQDDLAITLGAIQVPTFDKHKTGFNIKATYYLTDEFSIGGQFVIANKIYRRNFGFNVDNTFLNSYTFNASLQYDVVNTEKFVLGLGINNGILIKVLRNPDEMKEEESYDPETGETYIYQIPKRLNTDAFYVLTPNVDFSYRIVHFGTEEDAALFFNCNVGYQIPFGVGDFSKPTDFRNYIVSLGFTIKGSSK